jgi:hypothetical protein
MGELIIFCEIILSITCSAIGIGGFLFTIRHRKHYSCWARSSIFFGALVALVNLYNYEFVRDALTLLAEEGAEIILIKAMIQSSFSLSIILFTFTILRLKRASKRHIGN